MALPVPRVPLRGSGTQAGACGTSEELKIKREDRGWLSSCGPGNSRKQPPHRVNSAVASGGLGPDAGTLHQGPCRCCPRPPLEAGLWPLLRHRIFRRPGNLAPASQPPSGRGHPLPLPTGASRDTRVRAPGGRWQTSAQLRMWSWSLCGPACPATHRSPPPTSAPLVPGLQRTDPHVRFEVDARPSTTPTDRGPTLAPDRIGVCPDPGHRHAGRDISIHSALGETSGAGGTGCTRDPVTPALGEAQAWSSSDPPSKQARGSSTRLWGHPVHPTCRPPTAGWA